MPARRRDLSRLTLAARTPPLASFIGFALVPLSTIDNASAARPPSDMVGPKGAVDATTTYLDAPLRLRPRW